MKTRAFMCLMSIIPGLIYTANDEGLKEKEQSLAIEKLEEIYGNLMQKAEDDRCKKMTRENANPCFSQDVSISGLSRPITFHILLDDDGKTTRGEVANRLPETTITTIGDQNFLLTLKKNIPHKETFYKKIDLFELRENRHYPFKSRARTVSFKNIAKITTCFLMALNGKNSISFSENGPYEITLTHNLPETCIERKPFVYKEGIEKQLRRYDLFIGYLNTIRNHIITPPNAHVTFNATLPTTLEELVLSGILSDYTLNNAPQNLKLAITGRHSTFDINKQKFKKEIELSGNGNEILYDPSRSTVKIDPTSQSYSLITPH